MQCTLKFNSLEDVKAVLDDLVEAKSEHLAALRTVLYKELRDVTVREMSCFTPTEAELVPCTGHQEPFNRDEYQRCGDF